jgi:hypothetical protein
MNVTTKCVIRCQDIDFCYLKNILICMLLHVITRLSGQKAAPLLHLPGRRGRHCVTSVGTDTSTWSPRWGFLGFSHSVWVNAGYFNYVTTFSCKPFPMHYLSTIEPSDSTREGWPARWSSEAQEHYVNKIIFSLLKSLSFMFIHLKQVRISGFGLHVNGLFAFLGCYAALTDISRRFVIAYVSHLGEAVQEERQDQLG